MLFSGEESGFVKISWEASCLVEFASLKSRVEKSSGKRENSLGL
jgi:hypothetical protein